MSDKESRPPSELSIIDNSTSSAESGESLQLYMRSLQGRPLLKKEEEIKLALSIRSAKATVLTLCCNIPDCLTEFYLLKDLPSTELRKLFFTMIEENSVKSKIPALVKKMERLIVGKLENKPNSDKKLLKFLNSISFTLVDLEKISASIKKYGTEQQKRERAEALHIFKDSKNKLIESNLRLVFARAKGHATKGLPLEDLLQEGNIGLIKAIEKYDPDKGYKFSTYATWWIDQAIGRAIADKARLIRIPVHMVENINKVTKSTKVLTQKLGRIPSVSEVSSHSELTTEKVKKVKDIAVFPHSVEEPTSEIGIPLSEFLMDVDTPTPYEMMEQKEIALKLRLLLSKLTPKQEKILRMRFGIGERKVFTLSAIGKKFDCTAEYIRQAVNQGISKLGKINKLGSFQNEWNELVRTEKGQDKQRAGVQKRPRI